MIPILLVVLDMIAFSFQWFLCLVDQAKLTAITPWAVFMPDECTTLPILVSASESVLKMAFWNPIGVLLCPTLGLNSKSVHFKTNVPSRCNGVLFMCIPVPCRDALWGSRSSDWHVQRGMSIYIEYHRKVLPRQDFMATLHPISIFPDRRECSNVCLFLESSLFKANFRASPCSMMQQKRFARVTAV